MGRVGVIVKMDETWRVTEGTTEDTYAKVMLRQQETVQVRLMVTKINVTHCQLVETTPDEWKGRGYSDMLTSAGWVYGASLLRDAAL